MAMRGTAEDAAPAAGGMGSADAGQPVASQAPATPAGGALPAVAAPPPEHLADAVAATAGQALRAPTGWQRDDGLEAVLAAAAAVLQLAQTQGDATLLHVEAMVPVCRGLAAAAAEAEAVALRLCEWAAQADELRLRAEVAALACQRTGPALAQHAAVLRERVSALQKHPGPLAPTAGLATEGAPSPSAGGRRYDHDRLSTTPGEIGATQRLLVDYDKKPVEDGQEDTHEQSGRNKQAHLWECGHVRDGARLSSPLRRFSRRRRTGPMTG